MAIDLAPEHPRERGLPRLRRDRDDRRLSRRSRRARADRRRHPARARRSAARDRRDDRLPALGPRELHHGSHRSPQTEAAPPAGEEPSDDVGDRPRRSARPPALAGLPWSEIAEEDRTRILRRSIDSSFDPELLDAVGELIEDVRAHGDAAVSRALERFDRCTVAPDRLRVEPRRDRGGGAAVAARSSGARSATGSPTSAPSTSASCGARVARSSSRPGSPSASASRRSSRRASTSRGKGSFPSVLMQIGTPAVVAGVPRDRGRRAADRRRRRRRRPGGALRRRASWASNTSTAPTGPAGIAALTFGTETIPRVRMIAGPGSPPITAAQILVQLYGVRTHLLLGPVREPGHRRRSTPTRTGSPPICSTRPSTDRIRRACSSRRPRPRRARSRVRIVPRLEALPEPRRGWAARSLSHFGGVILVEDLAAGRRRRQRVRAGAHDRRRRRAGRAAADGSRTSARSCRAVDADQRRQLRRSAFRRRSRPAATRRSAPASPRGRS